MPNMKLKQKIMHTNKNSLLFCSNLKYFLVLGK